MVVAQFMNYSYGEGQDYSGCESLVVSFGRRGG